MKNLILAAVLSCSFIATTIAKSISINVPLTASSFDIETKKLKGKIKKNGNDSYSASKLSVKVKHLSSGMELRDEHMKNKDRLDAKKYPKILITKVRAKAGKGTAFITIKKVKKKIKFKYSVAGSNFKAKFKLNLKHFPLKKLKYLGVGVKGIVTIVAEVPITN
jgi:polyisoprenoid-binding protein YceI